MQKLLVSSCKITPYAVSKALDGMRLGLVAVRSTEGQSGQQALRVEASMAAIFMVLCEVLTKSFQGCLGTTV